MKMDQDKITDALYWRRLDYVLVIPEGAGKTLAQGEIPELSCMKVPGYFDSAYFEAELQMYLQKQARQVRRQLRLTLMQMVHITHISVSRRPVHGSSVMSGIRIPLVLMARI